MVLKINDAISQEWEAYSDSNYIFIKKLKPIEICNFVNRSSSTQKETQQDLLQYKTGNVFYKLKMRIKERLSEIEINHIKKLNDSLNTEIRKLDKKYKLEKIEKTKNGYNPANQEEKKRVENYKKQKERLKQQQQILPDYNTQLYSVYYLEQDFEGFQQICLPDVRAEIEEMKLKAKNALGN